ncbi:ComEA family DNA-binding protein [Mycolicibacterium mengxianglii]|uniref:ComEA family DNA-binding protein n=1 Tax=Mycolicibacterium mengxianglii TaxID=2736649 RepID=UPI0018D0A54A|nr:ComEA family DNA-binding protein [Mycolicibacterium mengxianglii]
MPAELPTERLHRRLGETAPEAAADEAAGPPTDDPRELLPRWLPDAHGERASWWETVRADPGRGGAIALGVVAALAVLVTVFTLIRDEPEPVTSAKLPAVEMVSSASARPSPAPDQPVIVSVVGLVHKPGLVTLTAGARVADALTAAGGVTDGADTIGLNMARHLSDGEQVVVGLAPVPGQAAALASSVSPGAVTAAPPDAGPGVAPPTGAAAGPVDLNSATVEQLDTLPGIGPVTAAAIVAWRDDHGSFASVDQLSEVDGIGPARLDKLRDLVRV